MTSNMPTANGPGDLSTLDAGWGYTVTKVGK